MKAPRKKPTLAEVRVYTKKREPFFFAKKNMRYFGRKFSEMKIVKSKSNVFWLVMPFRSGMHSSKISFYGAERIVMSGRDWYFATKKSADTLSELKKKIGV